MTAEQLEELAGGANPAFMGLDYDEVITCLARRVIAAEKLVEAVEFCGDFDEWWSGVMNASTAYREASK